MKCRPDGFLEGLVFLASRQGMTPGQRDYNERFRHVHKFLVVPILDQGDSTMNHIIMPVPEVFHAGFNLGLPARGHGDIAAMNFQLHESLHIGVVHVLLRISGRKRYADVTRAQGYRSVATGGCFMIRVITADSDMGYLSTVPL